MTIMNADGFPKTHDWITVGSLNEKSPIPLIPITRYQIASPGWDPIAISATDISHIFHFMAANPEVGSIEAVIDVSHQGKAKSVILQRTGSSEAIDILLEEAKRVLMEGYWAKQPTRANKLVITRYSFNTGICAQRYVNVYLSKRGLYVIPGYFHGVKPEALGQFFNHRETAEIISLPENLDRDRRHFDRCMFRLIRRTTREVIRKQNQAALETAIKYSKVA